MKTTRADVAIIGGGIAGLTAAISLLRAGLSVVVIDDSDTRKAASWINAGTVALQNKGFELHDVCLAAIRAWSAIDLLLGGAPEYKRSGGYRVACTDNQSDDLQRRASELKALGVQCEIVSGATARTRMPWLSGSVQSACFCPQDGFASPLRSRFAFWNEFRKLGGIRVPSVLRHAMQGVAGVELETSNDQSVTVDYVIIAAGAWSTEVSAIFGRPIKTDLKVNILSVTERVPQFMHGTVTTHAGGKFTLKQFPNGSCVLGGGYSGTGDLKSNFADIDHEELRLNLQAQCDIVPALESLLLVRAWAGFSETAFSRRPVVDAIDANARVWIILTGDIGFTLGPLFGEMAADAVRGTALPEFTQSLRLS